MATTTSLNGTITAGASFITLTAFTNPATTFGSQAALLFATGECCLITDATLTPTLQVVRGYRATTAVAHTTGEGVQYGVLSDGIFVAFPQYPIIQPVLRGNAQSVTSTGATGTDAAIVTAASSAFLDVTGVSGTGINLPVPQVGDFYSFRNNGTGVIKFYSVGATINGTTGTTAVSVSATGNLGGIFQCAVAGAWKIAPMPT